MCLESWHCLRWKAWLSQFVPNLHFWRVIYTSSVSLMSSWINVQNLSENHHILKGFLSNLLIFVSTCIGKLQTRTANQQYFYCQFQSCIPQLMATSYFLFTSPQGMMGNAFPKQTVTYRLPFCFWPLSLKLGHLFTVVDWHQDLPHAQQDQADTHNRKRDPQNNHGDVRRLWASWDRTWEMRWDSHFKTSFCFISFWRCCKNYRISGDRRQWSPSHFLPH